ncbi:DUF445 domain-containing protein [Kineosporia rhizophila]|uniref:DUF445 domain-containing protein n=1 Tax=Kineosporia TaxID=49184 RepID=UPI001E34DADC|nr:MULTISPECIES: DUF445 domain-containing protein [Kineosporia]MCE0536945.1 DUF445 domain-containing protein [Kineosporia rhizophila]GLY19101.1 membrane protein [Kineosporia sp. NBRC 101677]
MSVAPTRTSAPEPASSTAPASPRLAGSAEADELRRVRLRRMKAVATALLVVAAVIYLVTLNQEGPLGFVNAAAEAAMVGALADWFAVTALFRRPLGLPIPHTALIPTRKNQIGESLQEFVADNFLSEDIVREKIRQAEVTRRVGNWLAEADHAERVGAELATAGHGVLSVLRDDDVAAMLEQVVVPRAADIPVSPLAGGLLDGILDDGAHRRLVDLLIDEGSSWLEINQDRIMLLVTEQAPGWTPQWVDNRIARRVYDEMQRWLTEIAGDQQHPARQALDDLLRRLARDLRTDPETQAKVEAIKIRLLEHPELRKASIALWSTVRRMLIEALADPEGELRRRMVTALVDLGNRLGRDKTLQARLDSYAEDVIGYVVRNYAGELAMVISETVQRWDAEDASRRIELHVGRDLQFIRINGTVVGALAGLVIHSVAVLVG